MTDQMGAAQKRQFAEKMTANRASRKADMTSLLGGGNVDGWVGEIVSVRDATRSDVAVIIDVGCDAKFEAVALDSANTVQTVIPKSSPLYGAAKALKEGDRVSFSGHLIQKTSLPDGYQELSFGDIPSLQEPRFNFTLTKLAASR
jgi:hypothetical protein